MSNQLTLLQCLNRKNTDSTVSNEFILTQLLDGITESSSKQSEEEFVSPAPKRSRIVDNYGINESTKVVDHQL